MTAWLQNNAVTIVTVMILAAVVIFAVVSLVRGKKKSGKERPGGCGSCPYCASCKGGK